MLRWLVVSLLAGASAFAPARTAPLHAQRRQRPQVAQTIRMGSMAKFGVFSPAVYAGRIILGDKRLEKVRGQGISLHSQAITEFCVFVGATPKMRGLLIKKAKTNGDTLGFLV
jgi:hypothetical protein|tara:strand:+ start:109 stop:447 length:339 start_codon:yes stop_codon:yes gene_type:complete